MIVPATHRSGARYWGRHAVAALAALPPHAAVVVPEQAIRGYARSWCERHRGDLVVLAPGSQGNPAQDGSPGRGSL